MILALPDHIIEDVVRYLPVLQIVALSMTCKTLYTFIKSLNDVIKRSPNWCTFHEWFHHNQNDSHVVLNMPTKGFPNATNLKERFPDIEDEAAFVAVVAEVTSTCCPRSRGNWLWELSAGSSKALPFIDILLSNKIRYDEDSFHVSNIPRDPHILASMIRGGLDVNATWGCSGKECPETIVGWYLAHGYPECVKLLVRNGLDPELRNCDYDDKPIFGAHDKYEDYL